MATEDVWRLIALIGAPLLSFFLLVVAAQSHALRRVLPAFFGIACVVSTFYYFKIEQGWEPYYLRDALGITAFITLIALVVANIQDK